MTITETLKIMNEDARINSVSYTVNELINLYSRSLELLNKREKLLRVLKKLDKKQISSKSRTEDENLLNRQKNLVGLENKIVEEFADNDIARGKLNSELDKIKNFYDPIKNENYNNLSETECKNFAETEFVKKLDELYSLEEKYNEKFYAGMDYLRESDGYKKREMIAKAMLDILSDTDMIKRWESLEEFRQKVEITAAKKLFENHESDRVRKIMKEASDELTVVEEDYSPAQLTEVFKSSKAKTETMYKKPQASTTTIPYEQAPRDELERRLESAKFTAYTFLNKTLPRLVNSNDVSPVTIRTRTYEIAGPLLVLGNTLRDKSPIYDFEMKLRSEKFFKEYFGNVKQFNKDLIEQLGCVIYKNGKQTLKLINKVKREILGKKDEEKEWFGMTIH